MRIVCTTTEAAGHVLAILLAADLLSARDFKIQPMFSTNPPITFTMVTILTTALVAKIRAIPDTTVT